MIEQGEIIRRLYILVEKMHPEKEYIVDANGAKWTKNGLHHNLKYSVLEWNKVSMERANEVWRQVNHD